jgi:hypothetical protein
MSPHYNSSIHGFALSAIRPKIDNIQRYFSEMIFTTRNICVRSIFLSTRLAILLKLLFIISPMNHSSKQVLTFHYNLNSQMYQIQDLITMFGLILTEIFVIYQSYPSVMLLCILTFHYTKSLQFPLTVLYRYSAMMWSTTMWKFSGWN